MKELHEIVATKRLEEVSGAISLDHRRVNAALPRTQHAVQAIWQAISDLIDPSQPADVRHATLTFARSMISGQVQE